MKKKDPNRRIWGIPPKKTQDTPNLLEVLATVGEAPAVEPVVVPVIKPVVAPVPIVQPTPAPSPKPVKKPVVEEPLNDSDIVKPKKYKKEKEAPYKVECMGCHKIYWYHERPRDETRTSICVFPKCKSTSYMPID